MIRMLMSLAIVALMAGCASNTPAQASKGFSSFGAPNVGGTPGGLGAFHGMPSSLGQPANFGKSGLSPLAMPSTWRTFAPTK